MLRNNVVILVAFLGSIVLHLLTIPILYTKNPPLAFLPPVKATHLETPTVDYPEIELGIDNSKESTLTWIGYEEYEEQRAHFSEVEQASMKSEVDIAKPMPTLNALATIQQAIRPAKKLTLQFLEALKGITILTPSNESLLSEPISESAEVKPVDVPVPPSPTELVEDTPLEGNPSDRDSSATSIIEFSPNDWKLGQPLAAPGIVLRPKRPPSKPYLPELNSPSTLVAGLHISNTGKPQDVIILVSSGSRVIDRKWNSCLYRWRASGDQIDALEDEETLMITIQILFR
jgi:hypothetical protein|tara:strand:+ start:2164 stop:3027 length:864 start_codon:yes stop_codon:yes gene_type:complete